jgi:hypothetical protein
MKDSATRLPGMIPIEVTFREVTDAIVIVAAVISVARNLWHGISPEFASGYCLIYCFIPFTRTTAVPERTVSAAPQSHTHLVHAISAE